LDTMAKYVFGLEVITQIRFILIYLRRDAMTRSTNES